MDRTLLKQHVVGDPVTYGFTLHLKVGDHTTRFWRCLRRCLGTAFEQVLLGSHYFMVTGLGSCVKCRLVSNNNRLLRGSQTRQNVQ